MSSVSSPELSVVIPVFNEVANLQPRLFQRRVLPWTQILGYIPSKGHLRHRQAMAAWLSALIIGLALLAAAGAVALLGKRRLQKATPPAAAQAVGSINADVEVLKERARR